MNSITQIKWPRAKIEHLDLGFYLWNSTSVDSVADARRQQEILTIVTSFSLATVFTFNLKKPVTELGPFSRCHEEPL